MKRKITALILCGLLLFQITVPPAQAGNYLCFLAVGESILPLTDDTMPFWNGGYLYVSGSMFAGDLRDSLDIVSMVLSDKNCVILYSAGQNKALRFDAGQSYAYDEDNIQYTPGAVTRNGELYVPLSLIASFFNLKYTITKINITTPGDSILGDLAWIRKSSTGSSGLTEKQFLDAATYSIISRYDEYVQSKAVQQQPSVPSPSGQQPAETEQEEDDMSGTQVSLCLQASDNMDPLLTTLDRYGIQVTFFCDPEFLTANGDLLRRLTATGHAIGILAEGSNVLSQLRAGNDALEQATCGKTRLVYVPDGNDRTIAQVQAAGYCPMTPDLNQSSTGLSTAAQASSLVRKITALGDGTVTLWLGASVETAGLRSFITAVSANKGLCLPWTETTGLA